jgi:uncharacterized repeat protein (TIGR01451 family)
MVLAVLLALGNTPAWANNLIVNDLADPGVTGDGKCNLREAIFNADTNTDASGGDCAAGAGADTDTITFTVGGTVLLGSTLSVSEAAGLTLDGASQSVILSGNHAVRVMQVNPGANLTVKNLTVANGFASVSGFVPPGGGGIYNQFGTLTVVGSTFSGNSSTGRGGGIANYGDFNSAANPGGNLTVINSTFSGNSALNGGAIYSALPGVANVVNSTIVGNSALSAPPCPVGQICTGVQPAEGGGIDSMGLLNLDNSIVAGNTVDNLYPSDIAIFLIPSGSNNLIGDPAGTRGSFQNGVNGNIVGVDVATVLTTTLANNVGPTQTLALLPGSSAIDTALAAKCPATDQRSVARPQGPGCDIGAFEVVVVPTADLAVTETAAPNPVMVKDSLTWIITVINNGTANATGVKVVDTLPASGLKSITASASQGSCGAPASGKITCNLGSLANGTNAVVTVKAIATTTGTLTNQVTVSGDQSDGQLANNTATQATTVQALLCNGVKPTIVGTPGPDTLTGNGDRNIIHGLGGNDTIKGGGGNDIICGGEGQDSLKGESGNDTLDGGAGTDSCNGGTDTDSAVNCEAKTGIP